MGPRKAAYHILRAIDETRLTIDVSHFGMRRGACDRVVVDEKIGEFVSKRAS